MRILTFKIRKGYELAWIQYTVLDENRNWGEQSKSNFTFCCYEDPKVLRK